MPIIGYSARPEHDQVAPAAVVFGVSDPDDTRVRIPRSLLVDIVAVVVDALDVDTDQAALVEYLIERFAGRVVVVDDQEQDDEQALDEYDVDELAAWQAYGCPDCRHLPGCGCDCCPYPMPAVVGAEQLVGGAR